MFFPYTVDVPMQRWPIANFVLIGVTVVISSLIMGGFIDPADWMVIGPGDDFSIAGLFGSLFTHAGPMHLIGNMVFLFAFGNAINAKLGHLLFLGSYFVIGAFEGIVWSLVADGPAIGASGAIMGMMGLFIIFYPRNDVSVGYWIWFHFFGSFQVSAYVVLVTYFIFDLWGLMTNGDSGVAYLSHISGFIAGFVIASGLALTGLIESDECEQNLFESLAKRR